MHKLYNYYRKNYYKYNNALIVAAAAQTNYKKFFLRYLKLRKTLKIL